MRRKNFKRDNQRYAGETERQLGAVWTGRQTEVVRNFRVPCGDALQRSTVSAPSTRHVSSA